jgi:hypothetical protein
MVLDPLVGLYVLPQEWCCSALFEMFEDESRNDVAISDFFFFTTKSAFSRH